MGRKKAAAVKSAPWVPPQEVTRGPAIDQRRVRLRFGGGEAVLELPALRCYGLLRCPSCESPLGAPTQFPRTCKTCGLCGKTVWCLQWTDAGVVRWYTFHPPAGGGGPCGGAEAPVQSPS